MRYGTGRCVTQPRPMSTPPQPPNILVFFTDQQRWDSVGCYGNPMGLTPNLDRLAARGVRFEHAFTCQPVCAPARACVQSGQYASSHGVFRNGIRFPAEVPTLARSFDAAGYETGYIGKWHLGTAGTEAIPREERGGYEGFWEASDILEFTSKPTHGRMFDTDGEPIEWDNRYRVDFLTDRAETFVRRERSRPFFLFLSYLEPHQQNDMDHRFIAPEGYAQRFAHPWVPGDLEGRPGNWQSELPGYYGCVARLDECLGRLERTLAESDQLKRTVIVFTTDHGCHFRTRNPEYKRSCHEASLRLPLAMAGPGLDGRLLIEELVSLIDLPPTLLDVAGIEIPGTFQGRSLLPLVDRSARDWPDEIFFQISEAEVGRGIRTRRWKYSVFAPDADPRADAGSDWYVERYLYDLRADPHEAVNLVGRGDSRAVADVLRARLIERMLAAGEPRPTIEPARYYA